LTKLSDLSATADPPKLHSVAVARPSHAGDGSVAEFRTGDPAGRHSQPLLSIVTAPATPRPFYRALAWRYWLLALAVAVACWWAVLALL